LLPAKKIPYASGCIGALVCVMVVEAVNGPDVTFFGFQ
jgi:hypothetical protein